MKLILNVAVYFNDVDDVIVISFNDADDVIVVFNVDLLSLLLLIEDDALLFFVTLCRLYSCCRHCLFF